MPVRHNPSVWGSERNVMAKTSPTDNDMNSEAKEYFKHLGLVRQDVREELDLMGLSRNPSKIEVEQRSQVNMPFTFVRRFDELG